MKTIRIILCTIFVFFGLVGFMTGDIIPSLFCTLTGFSLIPYIYEKNNLQNNKTIQIILPIILFIIFSMVIPSEEINNSNNVYTEDYASIVQEKPITIEKLEFEETYIEIDLNETKDILLNITPTNSDLNELKFNTTASQIVQFNKNIEKSTQDSIYVTIKPLAEGEAQIYVSSNEIESNKIQIKIIDKERIENEKKAAEEQAKREAEELRKKELEKQAQQQNSTSSQSQPNTSTQSSQSIHNGITVYKTPTGKRYHYSSTCGGKNSTKTTLDSAIAIGLTPCQKCVY